MTEFTRTGDQGPFPSEVVRETTDEGQVVIFNSAPGESAPTSSPAPQSQED